MESRRVLLLAGSFTLAVGAALATVSGPLNLQTSLSSTSMSVGDWSLVTSTDGHQEVSGVTVSGIPQTAVGQTLTVYLHTSTVNTAQATITGAGSIHVSVPGHVYADQVRTVSLSLAG